MATLTFGSNIIQSYMKLALVLLILSLAGLASTGILPLGSSLDFTPNPNDIFKEVQFKPLNTLSYAEPQVEVSLTLLNIGYHGKAYLQVKTLYPIYTKYAVSRCRYVTLGLVRFYTFTFSVNGDAEDVKTAIETVDPRSESTSVAVETVDAKEGFLQISIEWAQQDPRISLALNSVIKKNWLTIGGNPLWSCWSKPLGGIFAYRFYFKGVQGRFEYREDDSTEEGSSNTYFTDVAPVFSVGSTENATQYLKYYVDEIEKHPAYPALVKLLEKELGLFKKDWIIKFEGSIIKDKEANTFKILIHFKPFLLKQTYEAYYYGSIQKAALLKVDESVFTEGRSYENWQNIEEFSQYRAFKEANEYILSQFTWLRFYKVVSAYSALHMKGRFVRLVYQGIPENNIDAGNQINIVTYIDECGKYYIERNDFLATNLGSYGRNNWVSLFVKTPDVSKAAYYMRIVKFFQAIYPKFWDANQLVDVLFKDGLHVVKFKNPTNLCYTVLNLDEQNTKVLSKVNWTLLSDNSPLIGRLENYVRARYGISKVMFIQFFKDDNGTHFEVSCLDKDNAYFAAYVLYIEVTDVFTGDTYFHYEGLTFSKDPLPADVKTSITEFLKLKEETVLAIVSFVSLSPTSFAIIGVSETGRWQITIEWQEGKWVVVSKQPYTEGYYKAYGYPSSSVASCTGFLARLYPSYFGEGWLYASIETKAVGVNLYSRLVYQTGGKFVEAVVGQTYGVDNSHVLYSWKFLSVLRQRPEYGYGKTYDFSYHIDQKYLYNYKTLPQLSLTKEVAAPPVAPVNDEKPADCPPFTRKEIFTGQCIVVF